MRFNVAALLKSPIGTTRHADVDDRVDVGEAELEVIAPVRGTIKMIRDHAGVLVEGVLSTRVRLPCARCLEPAEVDVALPIEEHFHTTAFIPGGPPVTDDPEEALDVATAIDAQHVLDIGEVVRQAIVIRVPLHPLCRPDCAGLCPQCGLPLDGPRCDCAPLVDPRWEALRALLESDG